MTIEDVKKIKNFSIKWITKVISKRKDYKERLLTALNDFIPDDIEEYDPYSILKIRTWDSGEYGGMSTILNDLIEYDNIYNFSKKAKDDFSTTLRIAIDLYIEQSGGVIGYNVGDLRKAFDNNIPYEINNKLEKDLNNPLIEDIEGIWL